MAVRLMEIASAEEQMALWKLINDNVWAAINQQARDEGERKAAAQRAAKFKGGRRKSKGASPSVRLPLPPPTKKAAPPPPQQQKTAVGAQQLPTRATPPQQLAAQPNQPIAAQKPIAPTKQTAPTASATLQQTPPNPLNLPQKAGFSARNVAAAKKW
jgi:hypothetical protein